MDLSLGVHPPRLHGRRGWMEGLCLLDYHLGPYHLPQPPLVPIQQQRDFGYQAGPADTRRDYGPPLPQPSWADQVEYQDGHGQLSAVADGNRPPA